MNYGSDNTAGVAPEILDALGPALAGAAMPYGNDEATRRLDRALAEVFETDDLAVFPVATGSAANSLALATLCPPWGAVLCHRQSHINIDECGAPEMFTGGAKLIALDGEHGRLDAATIAAAIDGAGLGVVHRVQPSVLSLTQATEAGTVYSAPMVAELAETARSRGLRVHMDGARFANAVVATGSSPADLTWRSGVDVLSLGATKNGCIAAEAVVFFDRSLAADTGFRRKRAGHLFSKMRFLSAQLNAWLADDLWLRLARQSNGAALRLAEGLEALPGVRLQHPVEANEIFAVLPDAMADRLESAGILFYRWGDGSVRLVTSFAITDADVDRFLFVAGDRTAT